MVKKIVAVVLATGVLCTGCGKKLAEKVQEKIIEKSIAKNGGGKADVKIEDGKWTVKTKDGESSFAAGGNVKLPDNFPKDVHVYGGATIESVMNVPDGCNVNMQSKDSGEKVLATYKEKMTADGWKEEMAMNTAQQSILAYSKENRKVNLIIVTADGNTQINLTVSTEKK